MTAEPDTALRAHTARKAHRCEDCGWRSILPGHRYEIHTVFPGHPVVNPDRPMSLKRCMSHAIQADMSAAFTAQVCSTHCCGTEPCARPFGHVGDCSCRYDSQLARGVTTASHQARLAEEAKPMTTETDDDLTGLLHGIDLSDGRRPLVFCERENLLAMYPHVCPAEPAPTVRPEEIP